MAPTQAAARECRPWPKDALRTGFWTSLQHPAITAFWAWPPPKGSAVRTPPAPASAPPIAATPDETAAGQPHAA